MNLLEGLRSLAALETAGPTDVAIKRIVVDSREAGEGTLFVALSGTRQEGRQFIGEAVKQGTAAIVFEGDSPLPLGLKERAMGGSPVTWIRVRDSRQALFTLASSFFGRPEQSLHLVGVTGTNGKTTTTFLVQSLLNVNKRKSGLIGTIHYDCGEEKRSVASKTTPDILELQALFAKMRDNGVSYVVLEVSSHSLDQRRVFGLSFDAAVFTNLTRDHLDYHHTMEAYFQAKKKLFDQTDGLCVINIDDPWGRILRSELSPQTLCYGIERHEEIYPKSLSLTLSGIQMVVETPLGEMSVTSPLAGGANVYNLLAAIGVGVATGLSKEGIVAGIAQMKSVPGRFEKIDVGQDFLVIVDYAHTEDALARLLQSVSALSLGHLITVVGCGGDRDRGKRPRMGEIASLYSRLSILTSDNPRSEPPLQIIEEMEAGILEKAPAALYEIIPDRKEAIARAIQLATQGDAVIIAGKGHERYQQIGDKIIPFDDREMARTALSERLGKR